MASGKKNYFRHNFNASKDPKIVALIDDFGKEAYFHYFRILELCASIASDEFPDDYKFTFRRSTLCQELRVTNSRLTHHLLAIRSSLLGEVVVTEKEVQILLPKLSKYMGRYETKFPSNTPNKRKEKKRKEKKIKDTSDPISSDEFSSEIKERKGKKEKLDFELIYAMYPRKEGKKKAIEKLKREVITREKYTQLETATKNYAIKCKNTELKFVLNFYTFSGRWEDYIEIQLDEDLESGKYDNMTASEIFAALEKESIEENWWEGVSDV